MIESSHAPMRNNHFFYLIIIYASILMHMVSAISPTFLTSLSDYKTGSVVLILTAPTTVNGLDTTTTQFNFPSSFSQAPNMALGLQFLSSTYTTTANLYNWTYDLTVAGTSTTAAIIQLVCTSGIVTQMSANYLAVLSTSFLEVTYSKLDLTSFTIYTQTTAQSRSVARNITYRTKSNSTNAVVAVSTVGMNGIRQAHTFIYSMSISAQYVNSYEVTLTAGPNNRLSSVSVQGVSYESVATTIYPPYYLSIGYIPDFSGTIPQNSGATGVTAMGIIFTGMTDWTIDDSNGVNNMNLSMSLNSYTLTSTSLTSCRNAYVWYRQQTCPQYYYLSAHVCYPCDITCSTCSGPSNTSCLSCTSTRSFNLANSSCPCLTGYVDQGARDCTAVTCNTDLCKTCAYIDQCGSCYSFLYRQLNGTQCVCMNYRYDHYLIDSSPFCDACHYSCYTCVNASPTSCTSCNTARDNRQFKSSNSTCACIAKFYDANTTICAACQYTCSTCTLSTYCTTCNSTKGRVLDATSTFCMCSAGLYDDRLQQQCQTCMYTCATCTSATACTTCPGTRQLTNTTSANFQCTCMAGYYDNGVSQQCLNCQYTCYTCIAVTFCDSCSTSMHRQFNTTTKFCSCSTGYYDDTINQLCASCNIMCLGCVGPTLLNCTSCDPASFRALSLTGECLCMDGYYQYDNFTKMCAKCFYTCSKCTNGTSCTACNNLKFRTADPTNASKCICMAGYFDTGNQLCTACPYYCTTCTNSTSCLTCDATRNSTLNCTCLTGFYDDGVSKVCQPCLAQCVTCTNPYNCTSCTAVIRYLTSTAHCKCSSGYYQPSCLPCTYQCLECTGTADNCVTCNGLAYRYFNFNNVTNKGECLCYQGYYSDNVNTLCKPCQFSCLNCTDSTACLSCPVNRVFDALNQYCVCTAQYYLNNQSLNCLPCHYSCQACSDYSVCTQCNPLKFRILNVLTKLCACSTGYYDDNISQLCYSCAPECKTCSSYLTCLTCDLPILHRVLSTTTNRCICTQSYYESTADYLCHLCQYSCLTCVDGLSCLTCVTGRVFDIGTGLCRCSDGTFQNSTTLACQSCVYPCVTCVNTQSTCKSCEASHLFLASSSSCYCPTGTYQNTTKCANCLPTCQACTTNLSCTTCRSSDNRQLTTVSGVSQCTCLTGFQDQNGVNVVCASCHYSCNTCLNSQSCVTCKDIRILLNGTNSLCTCPAQRYFDDGSNAACLPCSYLCLSCNKLSSNCTSCSSSAFRSLYITDSTTNSSTCLCLNKYYSAGVNIQVCSACHYSCSTCTSSASCQTCNATLFRIINTGTTAYCACMTGYYDVTNNQQCQLCAYSCYTCSQTSTFCLSCVSTRTLSGNVCNCNSGLFDDGTNSNPVCQACQYLCDTCSNSSTCLTCPSTRSMNSSSLCTCLSGYYDTGINKQCLQCHPQCKQCSDYSICTLCFDSTQLRVLYNSACICPPGYYDDTLANAGSTNYTCQLCHHSCMRCQNLVSCSSCDSNMFRTRDINTGLCKCIDGYYDDGVNQLCLACSFDCLTCADGTSCLTCPSQRYLDSVVPKRCLCSSTFYTNNTLCQSCPTQCSSCSNYTQCTACNNPTQRILTSGACLCNISLFPVANSASCLSCHYSCASCTSYPYCSSCSSTNHRYLSSRQCKCLPSFYDDLTAQLCQPCQYSCLTCTNSSQCLTCDTSSVVNRIFDSSTKFCKCNIGFYQDPVSKTCLSCNYSCYTCSTPNSCSACSPTSMRILDPLTNQCLCPSVGYFDQARTPICSTCSPTCYKCANSASFCTDCNSNVTFRTLISNNTCVCMSGYFTSALTVTCAACSYKCLTCDILATQCTSCSISNNRDNTTLPNCSCLHGFYDDGSSPQCLLCDYRCLTCVDGFKCVTCDPTNDHRTLNLISQMCNCDTHYYQPTSSSINRDPVCLPCHYSCLTCNHATLCLTCDMTNSTRVFNNGQCDCVPGYYDNGNSSVCGPCSYVCLTCATALTCQTCDPLKNRVYNLTSTLCECPVGYYDIGNGIDSMCYQCQSSCYTCTNSTACQSCRPLTNKYINSTQGTNFCICLYGYYQVIATGICYPCHYSCQRCSGSATTCTVCDAGAQRYLSSGSCLCRTSYFDDGRNQACLLCTTNCTNCFGPNPGQCLVCINGTYLLNGVCLPSCPDFYYPVNGPWVCSSCTSYCRNCTNSTVCLQCQSGFWLIASSTNSSNIICTNQCPQFSYHDTLSCLQCLSPCYHCSAKYMCIDCIQMYFLDNSTGSCYPCHPTCRYCTSSSVLSCISCVDGYYYNNTLKLCVKMSCTATQYVNSVYGCYNCNDTYANSVQCNAYHVTKCMDGYQIVTNAVTAVLECVRCDRITGYTLILSTGLCQQICGDGIRYNAACDDGNTYNGDGCSSICSIQPNWDCASSGNGSSTCTISASFTPIITADSVTKVPKSNKILVVLSLNIGIRLVKQNFHLKFGSNQKFEFSCSPANTKYTKFNLQIQYFQSIAKDKLSVQVISPATTQSNNINHRLLQSSSTASLSISLQLTLQVQVLTQPLALYYPPQQRTTYTNIIYIIIIVLHVITLLVACYFVLYLRLKNMLFVIQLINFVTLLYIYSTYGLYKVSQLTPDAARGLQFFIYKFGQDLPVQYAGSNTSAGYFGFGSFIISGCIIQLLILVVCISVKTYYGGTSSTLSRTQQQNRLTRYNAFRYYHLAFVYTFLPDLLLCCAIIFKWTQISSSVQSAYSWGIGIVVLVMIGIANVMYVIYVYPYARIIEKKARNVVIYPFNYFKDNKDSNQLKQALPEQESIKKNLTSNFVTIQQAIQKNSNKPQQQQRKYENINNDLFDPFNDEQPAQKQMSQKSHQSKDSRMRSRMDKIQDQNRTQAIIMNADKRSVRSEKSLQKANINKYRKQDQISQRSSKSKSTTVSQIQRDGLIPLFDMNPCDIHDSSVADSNISYHRHILAQSYLPFKCAFISLAICIVSQVQQPIPRCSLLIFCQLVTIIYIIFSMRFRNTRTIKLLIMSLILIGLAGCGLASALITQLNSASIFTGSDKTTITNQLYVIQAVQVSLIMFGIVWNIIMYLLQQFKSAQYRQYKIQQKNIQTIEKNKRKNRLRHLDNRKQQDQAQANNQFISNNVFSKMRNKHSLDYEDQRIDTKQHLRFDSEVNTPAQEHNQHTNSNILLGLTQRPSKDKNIGALIDIEDIEDADQQLTSNKKLQLNRKLKSAIDQSKPASLNKKVSSATTKQHQKQLFLNSLQQLQLTMQPQVNNNNNLKSTRIEQSRAIKLQNNMKKQRADKQSRLDLISRNDFMAMLENQLAGEDYNQTDIIQKKEKSKEIIDKDNTLISYKQSQDGNKRKVSSQMVKTQPKSKQSKNQLADLQRKTKQKQEQIGSIPTKSKQKASFSIIKDLVPTRQHDEDPNVSTNEVNDQPNAKKSSKQISIKSQKQIKQKIQNAPNREQEQQNSSQSQQQNSQQDEQIQRDVQQYLKQAEQQNEQRSNKHYMYAIKGTSGKSKQKNKPKAKSNKKQVKKPQSNRSNNPSKQKQKKSKKIKRAHTNPYDIVKSYNQALNSQDEQYQKQQQIEPKIIKKANTYNIPLDLPKGIKDDGFEKQQQIETVNKQVRQPKEAKSKKKAVNLKSIDSISSISEDLNHNLAKQDQRAFVQSDGDQNQSEGVTVFKKILQDYQIYKDKRVRGNPLKKRQ